MTVELSLHLQLKHSVRFLKVATFSPPLIMNSVQKDWFTEQGVLNADQVTLSLKCDKILHKEKSEFQELLVFHR